MRNDGPVSVRMFGGLSITCSFGAETRTVTDGERAAQKRWVLLEYLILHRGRIIEKEELCAMLWPDGRVDAPLNTLKTLVHRLRASLDRLAPGMGKDLILCQGGVYRWNARIPTVVDTEEFDRACESAEAARTPVEALAAALRAAALYTGDFLPRSAGEPWVSELARQYRGRYLRLCRTSVAPLTLQKRWPELLDLLRRAIDVEPLEEELHIALIRTLIASGDREGAMRHYNSFTAQLMNQLGVAPSEALTSLYRELARTTNLPDMDLGAVRRRMAEEAPPEGAFFCEYEVFKEVFQLHARGAARTGQVVQLAMISVLSGRTSPLTARQLHTAMARLDGTIRSELRQGDAYTRYSPNQYLLMLPSADFESGGAVLSRLVRAFRRAWPKMTVILHYSLLPVLPKE